MADFAGSIRKIAKTKELTDKVDRLIKEGENPVKSNLISERRTAYPDSSGSTSIADAAAAGANVTIGTDKDGVPVEGPPAPPPSPPPSGNTGTSITTSPIFNAGTGNNGDTNFGSKNDNSMNTDQSSNGHETINNGGGSAYVDTGLLGEGNAQWLTIKNALLFNNATQDQIDQARINFLRKELGIDEIGDMFTGKSGATPADTTNSIASQSNTGQGSTALSKSMQRGLVGVDPSDNTKALMIRFDGVQPYPSDADAAAAGLGPWESPDRGPYLPGSGDFQLGYYWVIGTGYTPADIYGDTPTQAAMQLPDILDIYESANAPHSFDSVSMIDSSHYLGHFSRAVGGDFTYPIGRISCTTYSSSANLPAQCSTDAPRTQDWPDTGLGMLVYKDGKFTASPFDKTAPLIYRETNMSQATVKSLSTGENYIVEPAVNGGFMVSQETDTPYIMVFSADGQLANVISPNIRIFYTPK